MPADSEQVCLQMILHAGNARAAAYQALASAALGDFPAAQASLEEADRELALSQRQHQAALAAEAQGVAAHPTLLLVHAEDQLMTASSERTLVEQVVQLYRRLDERCPRPT